MKLIVEKQGEIVKAIKAEYTPTEALIINQAMRKYACDDEVNEENRTIMEYMLEVEPIFVEQEPKTIQEKQAESEKYQKAFDDGYENGYAQARFDYEQEPCEDKIIEWKKDFKEYINALSIPRDDYKGIMEYIDELPVTSQEPCEDAISREDLEECKELMTDINGDTVYAVRMSDIRRLPSVKPQPKIGHWIPVSERLPKAYQKVLVTYEEFNWANDPTTYGVKLISFGGIVDFIAWMPLPEPYKPESEENKNERI